MSTRREEGDEQDQAVATCLNMWRQKEKYEQKEQLIAFAAEATEAMSLWQVAKEKVMRTIGGQKYPATDFLVVEDPQKPSTWHLQVKRNGNPDHNLMGAARAALTSPGGHRGNRYQGPGKQGAMRKLKRLYAQEDMEWKETNQSPFMVWKEEDTGQYCWLAVYSNKWRDDDKVPEILSEAAHLDFVKAIDNKEWPYPDVWLWHTPGTKFGVANFVAYDSNGFALASGIVDKDKANIAKKLSQMPNLFTSHGMPGSEIERDGDDPTVITRYRSKEISPLPFDSAANKHGTGFSIVVKEEPMALPDRKRAFLEDVMGTEGVAALEEQLAAKAAELEAAEIESKEEDVEETEDVEEAVAADTEPVEDEEADEVADEKEQEDSDGEYVTVEEVAQAVGAYLSPLLEQLTEAVTVIGEQGKEIAELKETVAALQGDDEERIKDALFDTPGASLFYRIGTVIGNDETWVDGRSKLGKAGPVETKSGPGGQTDGPTRVGLINEYLAQMSE